MKRNLLKSIIKYLKSRNILINLLISFIATAAIGFADYTTGYRLDFSLFYLLPVAMLAWLTSKYWGNGIAVLSSLVWLLVDIYTGNTQVFIGIHIWNTCVRLSFFFILVYLLDALQSSLNLQTKLARHDPLTGAVNSRYFYELLEREIKRQQRYQHPFTLVYIDMDDFKAINDRFGHSVGDQALCSFVNSAKANLRNVDVIGRLGGDEFVLLLPETDQIAAKTLIPKIQSIILHEMQKRNLPVTLSIGVLTCREIPQFADQIITSVDRLMYDAKLSGKNAMQYSYYINRKPSALKGKKTGKR